MPILSLGMIRVRKLDLDSVYRGEICIIEHECHKSFG